MLNIWVKGFRDDCITNPGFYFDMMKKKEWFNRPDVKEVIKEIDNTIAVKDEYLESPIYGGMAPERLSQGCKAVILLYINPSCNVYASRTGDNCIPSILRLAKDHEVVVTYHHIPIMPNDVEARFLDTDVVVHGKKEFVREYGRIKGLL